MRVLNAKNESTFRYVHWTIDLRRYVALWARNSGYEPQHVESKCLFFENGWPWEQSDPLAKKHWHLLCMQIPTGLCVAGYTFDGEEKGCTAGILVFFFFFFLFYVQHQLHPTALFVCTTMRSIYIVLCIAARRRYHNTFQDIHKQRDYSIFFCLFYHLFAKVPACHEIVLLL